MRFERTGLGIVKGMALTLKHVFRPNITTQYPEERLVVSRRHRGPELVWFATKCTGCATCAKACPQGIIRIVTSQYQDNKWRVEEYEVEHGRCMFCGLCVEACPFDALYMGRGYERATYFVRNLVVAKESLEPSPDRQPSAYFHPDAEAQLPSQTLLVYRERKGRRWLKL